MICLFEYCLIFSCVLLLFSLFMQIVSASSCFYVSFFFANSLDYGVSELSCSFDIPEHISCRYTFACSIFFQLFLSSQFPSTKACLAYIVMQRFYVCDVAYILIFWFCVRIFCFFIMALTIIIIAAYSCTFLYISCRYTFACCIFHCFCLEVFSFRQRSPAWTIS